jgi:HK97 family phage major capsid protein
MTKHLSPRKARGIVAVRADASGDIKAALTDLNRDWEAFKAAHNEELAGVKAKFEDVVTKEKVDRINESVGELQAAVDDANARIAAHSIGAGAPDDGLTEAERAYRVTFENWFRTGEGERDVKAALKAGGIRASYEVGDDSKGGYTAPIEWDRTVTDKRVEISPMRRYASVQSVTGQGFTKLYNLRGTAASWVGEKASRPETAISEFAEYAFSFGEIYAMPGATERILEDSELNIEAWLAQEVNTEFARAEGVAFISGDGVNKPKGVLKYTATDEGGLDAALRHPLGPIESVPSGHASQLTVDGLIDLIYDLPEDRSQGAALYANRKTHAFLRKMVDGDGNLLWQPSFAAGEPPTILGQAIRELSGLPDVEAGEIPVVYGNMAEGYRVFDRVGMSMLRDPYTNKPYVMFYIRKRVGGGLWNPEWLRYHTVEEAGT